MGKKGDLRLLVEGEGTGAVPRLGCPRAFLVPATVRMFLLTMSPCLPNLVLHSLLHYCESKFYNSKWEHLYLYYGNPNLTIMQTLKVCG